MLQKLFDKFDGRLQCSYEEKLEVLETVKEIYKISCQERREGLLALEDVAVEQKDMFFKNCILLVVEGVSPEALEEYASIWMLADNAKGKRLLEMAVIADGVVQILKGENPDMIFHRLGAWFGSEFAEKFDSTLQGLFAVLFDRILQCSYEEKLEVLEIINKICEISCLARREGLLALEDVAAEQEDMFFKNCILLVVEGVSPEALEEYASIWMLADNAKGKRLLEMAVIADGVVQILKGENPDMIFHRLGAWFGRDFAEEFGALRELKRFPSRPSALFVSKLIDSKLLDSKLQCSYEEKLEVLEIINKICEIACFARREGLLALKDVIKEQEDGFFGSCLCLASDGDTPEELERYASVCMLLNHTEGKRLLEMAVIADGVVQIRKGENQDMIFRRLGAWLGSEFAEKFESDLQKMRQQEKISRIESRRESRLQSEHSFFLPFDAITEYTPEKILRMIMQGERLTLVVALLGASGQVYRTVMNSISQTEQEALEQEMDIIVRRCDVEKAQKMILGWEKL